MKNMMKQIRYLIEAAVFYLLIGFFRLLPLDAASALGGRLARMIGPHLAASRKARRNIARALPDLDNAAQDQVIADMWDNLGRVFAEMPHLEKICAERVEIVNPEIAQQTNTHERGAVVYGAHLSNWEILIGTLMRYFKGEIGGIYRAPNNPYIARHMEKIRDYSHRFNAIPKSHRGARQIITSLRNGMRIGLLIDQKYNEGMKVPFFGHPAMTSPSFVELGQKFDVPVIPFRAERLDGAHFRITLFPPIALHDENGQKLPLEECIATAHTMLEEWIRERPGQWLWLHRRWVEDKEDKGNDNHAA